MSAEDVRMKLSNLSVKNPDITDTADYKLATRDMIMFGTGFLVNGKRVDPSTVQIIQNTDTGALTYEVVVKQ